MATLIVQLSDLHCTSSTDPVFSRFAPLARAVASIAAGCSHCFIVLCGDLAQAGQKQQYEALLPHVDALSQFLREKLPHLTVHTVAIPGNHDCDFSQPIETRELVIQNLPPLIKNLSPHSDVLELLTIPQSSFFEHAAKAGWAPTADGATRIYWEREFSIGDGTIRFQCYNTACTSNRREIPGQLLYPVHIAASKDPSARSVAVAVSLLHHPLPWFAPDVRRLLGAHIERTSDIVLTGHEHVRGSYEVITENDVGTRYLEGGVLQDSSSKSSDFQCILLDTRERRFRHYVFSWDHSLYKRTKDSDWYPFDRNSTLARHAFTNAAQFEEQLADLGTAFTHPRKAQLVLHDIFVYPDLQPRGIDEEALKHRRPTAPPVQSEEVLTAITGHERVLISGQATSGKTTLAKALYVGRDPILSIS